jgi:rfaE bifunctional protein kinase chain/domain
MTDDQLRDLLDNIRKSRVGVLGDFCLDVYWFFDAKAGELSLETGLPTRPAARQHYELGGAGNVVSNMAAIGCSSIEIFGVIGADPWGREMQRILADRKVRSEGLLVQESQWATHAFVKPHFNDEESNRLDFGNFNCLADATADRLLETLAEALPDLDVVVINEQTACGIHTSEYFRRRLRGLMGDNANKIFIVDSRHFSDAYPGAFLKINDHEAAGLMGREYPRDAMVLRKDALHAAKELFVRTEKPVMVTRGTRGLVLHDEAGLHEIPAIQVMGKVDPVGAGDSLLAGTALALAAGAGPEIAAALGNIAAFITVQKLHQTGTASPSEILAVGATPDYIFRPELAEDTRRARYFEGTGFERVTDRVPPRNITHVIFDHDGTISSLREGWERIMEPMMIRAILGPQFESADDSLYHRVVNRVRDYIDKSTGIQTLIQMQTLVKMVREFGCVAESEILDEHGYKKIFNDDLMKLVRGRVEKFQRGELNVEDFTIKNAVALLGALHESGARLYLASGTDQRDLIDEATALGYADLFEQRIFGAARDVTKDAKRIVLDRILQKIGPDAPGLVSFGDGPVEIRETQKRGGFAIGVASDELRRFGINEAKRSRLIRAGADMIISDFSQLEKLLDFLHVKQ